jgi:hypothetical protein
MITNHRENDEYLEQARLNKIPIGLGLDIPLDTNLRFKRGNFNLILGHANVGKTYWVLWYLLALSVKHNLKHLIYSSENTTNGIKRNLIELFMGMKVAGMTKDQLTEGKEFVESHFDFIDTSKKLYTIEDFMKSVQALPNFKDYDSLMIDPHNSFLKPRGVNSHDHDYEVASKLRLYAKTTDTTIYLCTHASTEALRKVHPRDHDKAGLPIPPNSADAEGGGKWVNRADDFIVVHRYTQCPTTWMMTEIHVKKVKEVETGGKPTFLTNPVIFSLEQGTMFMNEGRNAIGRDVNTTNNLMNLINNTDCPF